MSVAAFGRVVPFVVLVACLLAACGGGSGAEVTDANLGETFTISVGEAAQITGEDLRITFDEVIGDSRCPENVTCIWEGVAASRLTIEHQGETFAFVLNQPGATENDITRFAAYAITHRLDPYPREGEDTAPGDYRLTLSVTPIAR